MLRPLTLEEIRLRTPVFGVAQQVFHGFLTYNCMHMAAAISYYSLLALFPLMLAFISAVSFILQTDTAEQEVTRQIGAFVPVSQELVVSTIRGLVQARGAASALATVGLLWTAMSVFSAIRKAVNAAWGINQPRPFLHDRLLDFGLMAGTGLLFLFSVSSSAVVQFARQVSILFYGETLANSLIPWAFLGQIIPPFLTFVTFVFIYRFLPNAKVTFKDVWFGALLAAIAFEVIKQGFVLYVQNIANFNLVYGSVGAIIALMLWVYISALILLVGASVSSVVHRMWGAGVPPEGDALLRLPRSPEAPGI